MQEENIAEPEAELDHDWIDKLRCLTREQITEAVGKAGAHHFETGALRSKDILLEEASKLEGELRQALESAVMEKQQLSVSCVVEE